MFKCQFCPFEGERSLINEHHIIPRELNGNNQPKNKVFVCPNCHNKIFIPNSTAGIHSIKKANSILIVGWLQSSGGRVLQYINELGEECFVEDKNVDNDF